MDGRISSVGVPLDDLPAGLVSRLVTIPVALFLRNSGHLVLYAQAGADATMLRRADLAGRFWIAAGDVPVVRAMLPQALARALAERPDDPVVGYREGYGLLIETIEQIFVPGCDPDESDIRLIEGAMDVLVDRHLADPTAAETSVTVLRRRHDWAYDALNTCLLSIVLGAALGIDRLELANITRVDSSTTSG